MYDTHENELILSVDSLYKDYKLRSQENRLSIKDLLSQPFQKHLKDDKIVHALYDISFSLHKGESLGIIGANGAGKSTLLKILSGVTAPTSGEVKIWGQVLSVLDIGTGFHPDLTGRENVYLNGEILGLSNQEIAKKYEKIVAFSEIGEFIDKPVKYYSSGMYLRLAFSVVINMDADILLFDEVLAVGDHFFREKCMDLLYQATYQRSFIFVSHNLSQIEDMCDRIIVLDNGQIVKHDNLKSGIFYYLEEGKEKEQVKDRPITTDGAGQSQSLFEQIANNQLHSRLLDRHGQERQIFSREDEVIVELNISEPDQENISLGLYFSDFKEVRFMGAGPVAIHPSKHQWRIPAKLMLSGYYHLNIALMGQEQIYRLPKVKTFEVKGIEFIVGQKKMPVPLYLEEIPTKIGND